MTFCYDGQVFGGADGACSAGSAANGIGHLTNVWNSVSSNSYTAFDRLGRVTASAQKTTSASAPFPFTYSYNRVGMTVEGYPSGRTISYQWQLYPRSRRHSSRPHEPVNHS